MFGIRDLVTSGIRDRRDQMTFGIRDRWNQESKSRDRESRESNQESKSRELLGKLCRSIKIMRVQDCRAILFCTAM